MEQDISYVVVAPCLNLKTLELCCNNSKAVIIAGYGMGNLPTANEEMMAILTKAIQKGVIICIKTQCTQGSVDDVYETGRLLTKIGCVLTFDMTIECIFAKLMYLLGKVRRKESYFTFVGLYERTRQDALQEEPSR
jgi:L-asparaginase/Glu-tRNA(Gln) amidotransferase subunit D